VPLFVYRSSAGSGKTTALVNEYLKITLQNPYEFRHVLAITFTNKAANEMKTRILDALDEILSGNQGKIDHYDTLRRELNLSDADLAEKAKQLQSLILHNYDEFSVSTIDAFVHRIIRTFATDVKLPQNFEVVIDKEDFVPEIVDELFDKVGSDKALTDIMVNFVMSQTEEEKSYNLGFQLNKFVERQIGEEGFQHLQKIDNLTTEDFVAIIESLIKKINVITSKIKQEGQKAIELIERNGLIKETFYYSDTGIYGFFEKSSKFINDDYLPPKARPLASINEDKWTSSKATPVEKLKIDAIKDQLINRFNRINDLCPDYFRLRLIHQKIYALALTHEIRAVFMNFTDRTQKVHISEFNKRINRAIAEQPVPFIYERLGRKYSYFLVDEFQDTSVLQWQNLLPLIEESLATNNFNMLVGDAKQAIYRFRNGEVELFVNLPKIFGSARSPHLKEKEQMLEMNYREVQLDYNWRSEPEIIQFNNDFFEKINSEYNQLIRTIYSGHKQKIPENKPESGGYVSIELIETENSKEYSDQRLEKIRSQVERLIAVGYQQRDICVLTRTNNYAIEVASYLIENNFNVITSESLLLISSPAVRLIIAFYNLLLYPTEQIYMAEFVSNLVKIEGKDNFHSIFTNVVNIFPQGLDPVFHKLNLDIKMNEVAELPVYEIAEYLVRKLELNSFENIYLHYFLDYIFEAQEGGKGEVGEFMELWQIKKTGAFITMPEGGNAIQVMTVHKAKGLKFEVVIIDLINRSVRFAKDVYWTDWDDPELKSLKVAMLPIKKDLEKIGLEEVYNREKDKTELDFLNLVYVAFTRAVSALIINGNIITGKAGNDKFTDMVVHFLSEKGLFGESRSEYEFGTLRVKGDQEKDREENRKIKDVYLTKLVSSSWEGQVHIAPADEVYWESLDKKPARTYGNLIHAMLAKVRTSDDIERVILSYHQSGLIDKEESEEITVLLKAIVTHRELEKYYREDVIVKNETDVFDQENGSISVYRPDRVVIVDNNLTIIDYKTGEKESQHKMQINRYAEAFEKMGFSNVNKKLVYLDHGVEVINL